MGEIKLIARQPPLYDSLVITDEIEYVAPGGRRHLFRSEIFRDCTTSRGYIGANLV